MRREGASGNTETGECRAGSARRPQLLQDRGGSSRGTGWERELARPQRRPRPCGRAPSLCGLRGEGEAGPGQASRGRRGGRSPGLGGGSRERRRAESSPGQPRGAVPAPAGQPGHRSGRAGRPESSPGSDTSRTRRQLDLRLREPRPVPLNEPTGGSST